MQKEDLGSAAEALSRAFATNPNTLATATGETVPAHRLETAFAGRIKHSPSRVFIAEVDGRIVGAMRIIEWPRCQASLMQNLKVAPYILGSIGGLGRLRRAMKLRSIWKKNDPNKPHWHLDPLGVTPEWQGKGVGSQMMEFYCDIIDKKGIEAYHETDKEQNVPFYQRFGFEVIGKEKVNGATNWFMLRPAKKGK